MQVIDSRDALRHQLSEWRHSGEHVALVPTMGNLHEGHLSLVTLAREHAERVVVSLFVNPTQFAAGEDFDTYPRTLERDKRRLQRVNADLLFVPDAETMYPFGIEDAVRISVPVLTDDLCGASRPGHFDGVTSAVCRLFSLTQPDVAVFGQKDYQQQLVIRRLVADLNLPIRIVTGETVREDDGLALSSRNQYLSDEQRAIAPSLYSTLSDVALKLQSGKRNFDELESGALDTLRDAGVEPEYLSIRRAVNLEPPDRDTDELVIVCAAQLGQARLIDNIVVAI